MQRDKTDKLDALRIANYAISFNEPLTISASALLYDAVKIFKEKQIDNIVVLDYNSPIGMLDIQDLVKLGLIG